MGRGTGDQVDRWMGGRGKGDLVEFHLEQACLLFFFAKHSCLISETRNVVRLQWVGLPVLLSLRWKIEVPFQHNTLGSVENKLSEWVCVHASLRVSVSVLPARAGDCQASAISRWDRFPPWTLRSVLVHVCRAPPRNVTAGMPQHSGQYHFVFIVLDLQ